jgi:hypothetical protein
MTAVRYASNYDGAIVFSDTCAQFHLQASTAETYTVPGTSAQTYVADFEYASDSNVFVSINAAPVIPSAGTTGTQVRNEFKPRKRQVKGGDVIQCITPDTTAYCGVSIRSI